MSTLLLAETPFSRVWAHRRPPFGFPFRLNRFSRARLFHAIKWEVKDSTSQSPLRANGSNRLAKVVKFAGNRGCECSPGKEAARKIWLTSQLHKSQNKVSAFVLSLEKVLAD